MEQAQRTRQPLPDFLKDAPELYRGLEFTLSSFMLLNTCRNVTFSEGPITYLDMCHYCGENDIYGTDRDDFIYLISSMDAAYLQWRRDNAKKQENGDGSPKDDEKSRGALGNGFR